MTKGRCVRQVLRQFGFVPPYGGSSSTPSHLRLLPVKHVQPLACALHHGLVDDCVAAINRLRFVPDHLNRRSTTSVAVLDTNISGISSGHARQTDSRRRSKTAYAWPTLDGECANRLNISRHRSSSRSTTNSPVSTLVWLMRSFRPFGNVSRRCRFVAFAISSENADSVTLSDWTLVLRSSTLR